MTNKFYKLYENAIHSYGELAGIAGNILTNADLSRDERQELIAWTDSYLARFEEIFECKPQIYQHIIEERFAPQTGLAHLVFNSDN